LTRTARLSNQSGMTLVEVLMVVFIIGLTTGLVVLTVPDRRPNSDTISRQLTGLIEQARDQAIFTGQPVGLVLEEDAFDLAVWRDPAWVERGKPQALPQGVAVELTYNAVIERPETWPDLVFDPTGLVDPVNITVRGSRFDIELMIEASGEVVYARR